MTQNEILDYSPVIQEHTSNSVCVVVPAFNEADNIEFVVREVDTVLSQYCTSDYEIIVVDDGSHDNTFEILNSLTQTFSNLRIFRNVKNIGVSPTLMKGFMASNCDYAIFLPADRQIPALEIPKFLKKAEENFDITIGWRINRLDPPHRLLISALYNLIIRISFGLRLNDIDSAFLLSRRAIQGILPQVKSDSAFMSVEIVLIGRKLGYATGEFIIDHRPRVAGNAKGINLRELTRVPVNFLRILKWVWSQKKNGNKSF